MPIIKKYNKDFFKTWSADMAYILGFMYADGNIVQSKRGNHYVALYTADRSLLISMKKCMKSDHKIAVRRSPTGCTYRIQIGSKEWFTDLGKIGMFPNKTFRMELPLVPHRYFGDFVRGYFDGDGNVWSGLINKKRKTPTRILHAVFTSGSNEYLMALHASLKSLGIHGGSLRIPKSGNFARLIFSTTDALKLYKIMYNAPHKLCLKRKKSIFGQFMKNCGRSSTG